MSKGTINVQRRRIIKAALIVVWIGLGILIFITNRGHSVLIDNRNVTAPELRAPDMIYVTLNKKRIEFFRGDRDIIDVGGGRHRILVEFSDGTPPFETTFTLPLGPDMYILSIPKMINNVEPYFEEFRSQRQPRTNEEEDESKPEALPDTMSSP